MKKHDSQLFRYFGTSEAKFAILTNGIIYRFYTDLEEANKMDSTPFLEVNILDIKSSQVQELKKFKKTEFSTEQIMNTASQLKYTNEFQNVFMRELQEPSDEFVKFFLSNVYSGQKTSAVIERFRPLIKDALNQFISETMNDKIKTALGVSEPISTIIEEPEELASTEPVKKEKKINTTEEELEAYFIVKNIIKEVTDFDHISYKDNERYMSINYDNKSTKWICRLYFNSSKKYITIPNEQKKEVRYDIENVYDIEKLKDQILEIVRKLI